MTTITTAVVYAAKSTADPHGSIPTQLTQCRAAAEAEGRSVVAEFKDEAASAYHGNRGAGLIAAKEAAIAAGSELWVQHSDRLARGDGISADHLAEIWFALRRNGVRIRSVQDDGNLEDAIRVVLIGERNNEDSKRKALAVKGGMRRSAERGEYIGRGIKLDGYAVLRDVSSSGKVTRTWIKDPERKHIFELMWDMARDGKSLQAIQLEFSTRGFLTAPVRKDHRPRPFDVNRISQALDNPAYAGIVVYRGEVLPNPGKWPAYVTPEDFHRLREERRARSHTTKRKSGRPALGYLLTELAVCGVCQRRTYAQTNRPARASGSRRRTYVCTGHRDHHRDSAEWCPAMPVDAVEADRIVLAGIDSLLADADALRGQLLAGRRAEHARLGGIAQSARSDAVAAERAAERAEARYGDALADDNDTACEVLLSVASRKHAEAAQATTRADAALDAINSAAAQPEDEQAADVLARVWEALSGRVADAEGDVRKLNAALREWFSGFELHHIDGVLNVIPVLNVPTLQRVLRDPERFPLYDVRALDNTGMAVEVLRPTVLTAAPETPLDLDEDQRVAVADDQVELAEARAVIALHELTAQTLEVGEGEILPEAAELMAQVGGHDDDARDDRVPRDP